MVACGLLTRRGSASWSPPAAAPVSSAEQRLCMAVRHHAARTRLCAIYGWWWADPAAAPALVPLIVREGAGVLRAKTVADTCCGGGDSNDCGRRTAATVTVLGPAMNGLPGIGASKDRRLSARAISGSPTTLGASQYVRVGRFRHSGRLWPLST